MTVEYIINIDHYFATFWIFWMLIILLLMKGTEY